VGIDIETRRTVFDQKKAHKSPINTMLLHENLIFSGDEDGVIKIWDQRQPEKVKEISENDDFISAFAVNADRGTLLATSGDQTLTVVDFGGRKLLDRSEQQDDELMSVALIKDGKKVVCGGSTGLLSVFTWDKWTDRSSVCSGHIESVDCIVPVDENTVITGCGDGIIRIVSILPNKILGVISAQGEELGISALSLSHDKKYLTACVDTSIQFWNVSILFDDDGEKEEGVEEEDQVVEENGEDGIEEDEEGELSFDLTPTSESDSSDDSGSDSDSNAGIPNKFAGLQQPPAKKKHFDSAKAAFFGDL
jgi:WD40 repeat protein